LVEANRMRFDFSHPKPLDPGTLDAIEKEVNELMWANLPVETREMAYADALKLGAMAFFSEKYGDRVRVVSMGPSIELCGGTHVRSTGQVGLFRIVGQTGVQAGVRRIEAVTGPAAYSVVKQLESQLHGLADTLKAQPEHVARKVDQLLEERERLAARVAELVKGGGAKPAESRTLQIDGVAVTFADTAADDRAEVAALADAFRSGRSGSVLVLFGTSDRAAVHVAMTDDLVKAGRKAGDLVNRIAAVAGGKGGGRPHFASGSVGEASGLAAAREAAPRVIQGWLAER
jgi:alanyl-tRNA synthetase